jgi:hypothetical protein
MALVKSIQEIPEPGRVPDEYIDQKEGRQWQDDHPEIHEENAGA